MKRILVILVISLIAGTAFGQDEINQFNLNYKAGNSKTPREILLYSDGTTDTVRFGDYNFFEVGAGAFLKNGFGAEFSFNKNNHLFDTIAGYAKYYTIGLAYKKVSMGNGPLFDNGFNTALQFGAGYINGQQVDQIERVKTTFVADSTISSSSIWNRMKTWNGFYFNGCLDIFRDNPYASSEYIFYSFSLKLSLKYPRVSSLSTTLDDTLTTNRWTTGDSVSIIRNIGFEVKPLILPINDKFGLSLITGLNYGNFNTFGVYDPGLSFTFGIGFDRFTKYGEFGRLTYTRPSRDNYVANGFGFGIELVGLVSALRK